jgi:sporulation protein YlmC with PRC-barrel domain
MKKFTTLVALAALAATFAAPNFAYAAASDIVMADHTMRASKIIGATVYNDKGESIGSVIDVLVKNTATEPTAILSVGDYVGGGTKLVAVPLSHVNLDGAKPMMAGATKQMLASMPAYLFKPSEGNGAG